MTLFVGILLGILLAILGTFLFGVYIIGPTERGVITNFSRVQRTTGTTADDPVLGALLKEEEKGRYNYPNIRVIPPGGPFFKWPWQRLYKVGMTIETTDLSWDPDIKQTSINDLRKNLSSINRYMEEACRKTSARYGIELDAALITTIDPPSDVDEALASINTTQNQVAAAISQSRADADQRLKMAEQAVQIAQNRAYAEAAPLGELGRTLQAMYASGGKPALDGYLRNASLPLREKASQTVIQL